MKNLMMVLLVAAVVLVLSAGAALAAADVNPGLSVADPADSSVMPWDGDDHYVPGRVCASPCPDDFERQCEATCPEKGIPFAVTGWLLIAFILTAVL
jgi:hypothetical protein